jgi:ABC-type branched-subunit amino acid transport system ATPase component
VAGTVKVGGRDVTGDDVRGKLDAGIGHIAEDRHRRGLVLDFNLAENLCLRDYNRAPIAKRGFISPKRMNERAEPLLEEYDVRGGSCDALALSLSGGNQQKVVIAREIAEEPKVLIAAQPTRGLDVGAIEFVHRRLIEQRDAGRGVLLVSLELEEIRLALDRVLVMYDGRIVAELAPEASEEEFGVAMLGGRGRPRERGGGRGTTPSPRSSRATCARRDHHAAADGADRVLHRRPRGRVDGREPAHHLQGDLRRLRPQLAVPLGHGEDRTLAALNLQQTLIITTPLILTGMAVAYAFRAGLFNIGGQGQYFAGSTSASSWGARCTACRASCTSSSPRARRAGGRGLGRDRGLPEGAHRRQRGDLDDHAQLLRAVDRGVGRSASAVRCTPTTRRTSRSRSPTPSTARQAAGVLGRPRAAGPARRALHRARRARGVLGAAQPLGAGYEARAVGFNPDAAEYGGIHAGGPTRR